MREPEMNMGPQMNFDTHKLVKFLITKGIKAPQAESIVEVVNQSRQYDLSKLATKDQLKLVEARLESKINAVEENLKGKINAVEESLRGEIKLVREEIISSEERTKGEIICAKNDMLKWIIPFLISMTFAVIGMILTVILKN
jgi:hypothetical protein